MPNAKSTRTTLGRISKLLTLAILISGGLTFWSNKKRNILPPETELISAIESAPIQSEVSERAFPFDWRGQKFVVHPVANYSITGLVVTRNDIGGFSDIYHTSDSVDVLDVCLVWGENTHEEVYQNVEFWSEPFSCWIRPKNEIGASEFKGEQLSNTHVLAKDESLARRLNKIRLGDQIRLQGRLVNYNPAGASEALRRSSTVRDDTGNGACEVMYVESFELLNRGNPGWNDLFDRSRVVLWIALALKLLSFLLFPYLEYRAS